MCLFGGVARPCDWTRCLVLVGFAHMFAKTWNARFYHLVYQYVRHPYTYISLSLGHIECDMMFHSKCAFLICFGYAIGPPPILTRHSTFELSNALSQILPMNISHVLYEVHVALHLQNNCLFATTYRTHIYNSFCYTQPTEHSFRIVCELPCVFADVHSLCPFYFGTLSCRQTNRLQSIHCMLYKHKDAIF